MKNKFVLSVLALILFFGILNPISANAEQVIKVTVDGNEVKFDQPPVNIDGRVYVPIRFVAEKTGWEVWTPSTDKYLICLSKKEMPCSYLTMIGTDTKDYSKEVSILKANGSFDKKLLDEHKNLSFEPKNINNRILLSVRDISEILYSDVFWEGSTKTVVITSRDLPKPENNTTENIKEEIQIINPSSETEINTKETSNNEVTDYLKQQEEFEMELIRFVNEEREKAGLDKVVVNEILMKTARWNVEQMAKLDYFSHTSQTLGLSHTELARHFGYTGTYAGENIFGGKFSPEGTVKGWMNSPGHRKHILNPKLKEIGTGYAYNKDSEYIRYWSLFMGY